MRRVTHLAVVACSLAPAATARAQDCLNFSDTFNPPSSLWTNTIGNWTASGGSYYAANPGNLPPTYSGLPFDLVDFTVKVTISGIGDGGIWLRSDPGTESGVLLVTGGNGYGQGVRGGSAGNSLYFHTVHNHSYSSTQGMVTGVFTPGSSHALRIVVVGTQYSVYLDGAAVPVTSLTNSEFTHGLVGLYDDQPNTAAGGSGAPQTFADITIIGSSVNCHCSSDFDGDGDFGTDFDIQAFFACLGGNCCPLCGTSDFNGDGDYGTDLDIQSFFSVLGGNECLF